MRFIIIAAIIVSLVSRAIAGDDANELSADLNRPWDRLVVFQMIDQGCVAPIYIGIQIRVRKDGLAIATLRKENDKETVGHDHVVKDMNLDVLRAAVLQHYKAAVASDDIHEWIARLPTDEERKNAWARVIKSAGGLPVGGFGASGIEIWISGPGFGGRYRDSYGATGEEEFSHWLRDITPKEKD